LDLLVYPFHHPEKLADRYLFLGSQSCHHRRHHPLLLLNHRLEPVQGFGFCRFLYLEGGLKCCHQLLLEPL
jgi:hypothetical protein